MKTIERKKEFLTDCEIRKMKDIDDMFFKQIQMSGDKVMEKFPKQFIDTKKRVIDNVKIQYLIEAFEISGTDRNKVKLANGTEFKSPMLAKALSKSEEVILMIITVHGYDEIEAAASDGFNLLFIDGWGTALAECANAGMWLTLEKDMKSKGKYITHGWSPGQHQVNIELQKQLFEVLQPEEIGVKLSSSYMMDPKKTISSIIGLGNDSSAPDIRACDFCEKRESCPSAYA